MENKMVETAVAESGSIENHDATWAKPTAVEKRSEEVQEYTRENIKQLSRLHPLPLNGDFDDLDAPRFGNAS